MPATYTHTRFGAEILPLLPVELHARIDSHRSLFDLGLHGPDIFFFYDPLRKKPVNQVGYAMHQETGRAVFHRFAALIDGTSASLAYVAGCLCHFALDSLCHGYVGEMEAMGMSHNRLEAQLDRALLVEDGKDPLREDLTANLRIKAQNIRTIARFYPQVTEHQVERALRDMVFYHGLLLARNKPKRVLLNTAFRVANFQDTFGAKVMTETEIPACRQMVARLRELYREAIPLAVALISRFPDLDDSHYDVDFNGNLADAPRTTKTEECL